MAYILCVVLGLFFGMLLPSAMRMLAEWAAEDAIRKIEERERNKKE